MSVPNTLPHGVSIAFTVAQDRLSIEVSSQDFTGRLTVGKVPAAAASAALGIRHREKETFPADIFDFLLLIALLGKASRKDVARLPSWKSKAREPTGRKNARPRHPRRSNSSSFGARLSKWLTTTPGASQDSGGGLILWGHRKKTTGPYEFNSHHTVTVVNASCVAERLGAALWNRYQMKLKPLLAQPHAKSWQHLTEGEAQGVAEASPPAIGPRTASSRHIANAPRITLTMIRWLRELYGPTVKRIGGELLSRQGHDYPVAFFPAHGKALDAVLPSENVRLQERISDSALLLDPIPRRRRHGLPDDASEDQEAATTRGDNLCMTTMQLTDGKLELTARVGTYGQIMDSSDAMIDELVEALGGGTASYIAPDHLLARMPLRSRIHEKELVVGVPNPFLAAQFRAAGIGISALVAYLPPENAKPHGIIAIRSSEVSTWRDVWHVFPSGMLGARYIDFSGYHSTDVRRAMLAEFAEELYDDRTTESGLRDHVDHNVHVVEAVRKHKATMHFTGIAFDLVNLRPEICGVVLIASRKWSRETRFVPNYEIAKGTLAHIRLDTDDAGLERLLPDKTVPAGAAAFWYGVDVARRVLTRGGRLSHR